MPLRALEADVARLALAADRLMDGDFLAEEESSALLTMIESARRDLESGDEAAAGRQVGRIVQYLEALVQAGHLDASTQQAALGVMPRAHPRDE